MPSSATKSIPRTVTGNHVAFGLAAFIVIATARQWYERQDKLNRLEEEVNEMRERRDKKVNEMDSLSSLLTADNEELVQEMMKKSSNKQKLVNQWIDSKL